jgi:transcriptional regulator NrdR family protein
MNPADNKPEKPQRGLICPKCGCGHFELVKISHAVGYVRRRRECRHCGHRVTTTERIVGGGPSVY